MSTLQSTFAESCIQPVSPEVIADLISSVNDSFGNTNLTSLDASLLSSKSNCDFQSLQPQTLPAFVSWLQEAHPEISTVTVVGLENNPMGIHRTSVQPLLTQENSFEEPLEITESPSGLPAKATRSLEDSWVIVPERDDEATAFAEIHKHELQLRPSFFKDWPSFGVHEKMTYIASLSGQTFLWGYLFAANSALNVLLRLGSLGTAGLAAYYVSQIAPHLLLKAAQFVIVSATFGGAVAAAPIFVIGTGGVFVAAGLYHGFEASKRTLTKASHVL